MRSDLSLSNFLPRLSDGRSVSFGHGFIIRRANKAAR
jgi:hypothetical protein